MEDGKGFGKMKRRSVGHPWTGNESQDSCRRTRKLWIGCAPVAWFIRSPRWASQSMRPDIIVPGDFIRPRPCNRLPLYRITFHPRPNKRRAPSRNCLGGASFPEIIARAKRQRRISRTRRTTLYPFSLVPILVTQAPSSFTAFASISSNG